MGEETPVGRCQRTDSVLFLLSSTSVSACASLLPITILQSCTSHLIQHCSVSQSWCCLVLFHIIRHHVTPFRIVLQHVTTSQFHLLKWLLSFFPPLSNRILSFFHHLSNLKLFHTGVFNWYSFENFSVGFNEKKIR